MLRALCALFLLVPSIALADQRLVGVWLNVGENIRFDILDGFKPNRGAVLAIENGKETKVGIWETRGSATTMQIGWRSSSVTFWAPDTIEWNEKSFKKQQEINEKEIVLLKQDKVGFIDKLTRSAWLTSDEGKTSLFKSTFSTDSGVVETFSQDGHLGALNSWGIASGVLKIGDDVIIEARVSQNYMIGINERDKFVVFRATSPVSMQSRADLSSQRSEFLKLLVTDTWQQVYFNTYQDYKFRPIEGPFSGRRLKFEGGGLEEFSRWGFSPSTGALKIGYTEYVGGLVIGDTLALIEREGDQTFYKRKPGGVGKVFTVADVKTYDIDETRGSELAVLLSGQFQKESYLYSFEFNKDNRTGYLHQWRSEPFTITGHELATDFFEKTKKVYEVEDLVLFEDHFSLKRDAAGSRLRPKTQDEAVEDKAKMEKRLQEVGKTKLILRISDVQGNTHDIALPFSSMGELSQIQLLAK